jgi:hypothetical protein
MRLVSHAAVSLPFGTSMLMRDHEDIRPKTLVSVKVPLWSSGDFVHCRLLVMPWLATEQAVTSTLLVVARPESER